MVGPKLIETKFEDGKLVLRMEPSAIKYLSVDAVEEGWRYTIRLVDDSVLEVDPETFDAAEREIRR